MNAVQEIRDILSQYTGIQKLDKLDINNFLDEIEAALDVAEAEGLILKEAISMRKAVSRLADQSSVMARFQGAILEVIAKYTQPDPIPEPMEPVQAIKALLLQVKETSVQELTYEQQEEIQAMLQQQLLRFQVPLAPVQ